MRSSRGLLGLDRELRTENHAVAALIIDATPNGPAGVVHHPAGRRWSLVNSGPATARPVPRRCAARPAQQLGSPAPPDAGHAPISVEARVWASWAGITRGERSLFSAMVWQVAGILVSPWL
jgi:hypothetical protein